jgi:hypothetical protein
MSVGGFPILNHDKIIPAREIYMNIKKAWCERIVPVCAQVRERPLRNKAFSV